MHRLDLLIRSKGVRLSVLNQRAVIMPRLTEVGVLNHETKAATLKILLVFTMISRRSTEMRNGGNGWLSRSEYKFNYIRIIESVAIRPPRIARLP